MPDGTSGSGSSPSISVVMPAYRSGDTVAVALDSIRDQSLPVAEILVVDDASPDTTVERANAWLAAAGGGWHGRVIRLPRNAGPAAARNAGIRAATGAWIAFLDADDAWLPWRLERQFAVLAEAPDTGFVCGETIPFESEPVSPTAGPPPRELTPVDFVAHNPVATSTVLVRRSALDTVGGFDERFRGPEDYDLWLRLSGHVHGLLLNEPLARYRHVVGSLSMDDRRFLPEVLRVLDKAFGPGGALEAYRGSRRVALAEQYASASWMAYRRGARGTALRLLLASWRYCPGPIAREQRGERRLRLTLLGRYLAK